MTVSVDRPGLCEDCGSPRQGGQRYCLGCGARFGSRSPQLERLLRSVREQSRPAGARAVSAAPATTAALESASGLAAAKSAARRSPLSFPPGLRIPSPKVSAALVLMFLGFGVIVGGVAGSPVENTLAASSGRHVKLILPPLAATPSTASEATPPAAEAEATPSPSSESESTQGGSSQSASNNSSSAGSGKKSAGGSTGEKGASGGANGGGGGGGGGSSTKPPAVKHVFVVMLSDQPYASVFGPSSQAHYLAGTLEHKGALLVRYYAVAHEQLANGVALISGQGPTPQTAQNCPTYENVTPGTVGVDEQVAATQGCVYPAATQTLAGQLTAKQLTWRAYLEGMDEPGAAPGSAGGACGHPALGAADPTSTQTPPAGQAYATWRNPFVYFHSLIDSPACASDDVGLKGLKSDLASTRSTPSFAYIVPDRCHDGNPTPCAPGAPAGMVAADGWLQKIVPVITGSKAYKENGLLVVTVDQAPSSGEFADSSSCCGQPRFPNLPASTTGLAPEGGGQVGALLLSPFVKPTVSQEPYNHFSLLRTIEDLFGLSHLGYAGLSKVSSFEPSLFSASG
jgi:phosphatidylinositol-3-phosphatase